MSTSGRPEGDYRSATREGGPDSPLRGAEGGSPSAAPPPGRLEGALPDGDPVAGERPRVVLVAAVARDGAIGRAGELVWREPADQRRFRAVTLGAPVVMGRRTWDSLPDRFRPLPGRRNLVLTRRADWHPAGAETVGSWPEALARLAGAPRVCVIGGSELYRLAIDAADELALTEIDAAFDADTWFPAFDRTAYVEHDVEERVDAAGRSYRFVTYRRRSEN